MIESINARNLGWTAGINSKFINATKADVKRLLGTRVGTPEQIAKYNALPVVTYAADAIPATFNATSAWSQCSNIIGHIRDQSDCGSCWAHGSTESFNDRMCIVHNYTKLLSVADTNSCCNGNHGCSSGGCDGGFTEDACNYFVTTGLVTGDDNPSTGTGSSCLPYSLKMCDHHEGGPYPLCPSICSPGECTTPKCPADVGKGCSEAKYGTAWAKDKHFAKKAYTVQGVAAIQTDIMTNGPVSASFTVYDDFLTYKSGVYQKSPGATPDGGHAVRIYGWGTEGGKDYWLVANSWNNYWGDFGSFKILRGVNECGIESDIVTVTV
jgi:cathepsin B